MPASVRSSCNRHLPASEMELPSANEWKAHAKRIAAVTGRCFINFLCGGSPAERRIFFPAGSLPKTACHGETTRENLWAWPDRTGARKSQSPEAVGKNSRPSCPYWILQIIWNGDKPANEPASDQPARLTLVVPAL